MSDMMYNGLKYKAEQMPSTDEFEVRCREAYETASITEDEYKELLAYRRMLHGPRGNPVTSAEINTGVE